MRRHLNIGKIVAYTHINIYICTGKTCRHTRIYMSINTSRRYTNVYKYTHMHIMQKCTHMCINPHMQKHMYTHNKGACRTHQVKGTQKYLADHRLGMRKSRRV